LPCGECFIARQGKSRDPRLPPTPRPTHRRQVRRQHPSQLLQLLRPLISRTRRQRLERKATQRQLYRARRRHRVRNGDRPLSDAVRQPRLERADGRALEGAPPRRDVRQQQLGVDVDDAQEQWMAREPVDARDGRGHEPFARRRERRHLGLDLADDLRELARHQRLHQRRHVGVAPVERHATHAGAPRDVRHRRAPHPDRQHARLRGVEQRLVLDRSL
jgi:hypothetical protein